MALALAWSSVNCILRVTPRLGWLFLVELCCAAVVLVGLSGSKLVAKGAAIWEPKRVSTD